MFQEWVSSSDVVLARQGDDIRESISQLEHCLQAAHQAHKAVGNCRFVTRYWFPLESTKEVRMNICESMENVGGVGHEAIGASYLRALGFSEAVCRLVNSHVAAKRDVIFHLSFANLDSPFRNRWPFKVAPSECGHQNPKEDLLRDDLGSLRLWDDAAKLEGVEAITPRTGAYLDMIIAHLLRET
ncbi:hypothetical protein N7527_006744 [Penicillium freii]|nr:hypothetical protein N7527_006744 [Penicillium freii]